MKTKNDSGWSLDLRPAYEHYPPLEVGPLTYFYDSVLKYVRVAVKCGQQEVLVFHAAKPEPPNERDVDENYFLTYRRTVDPDDNPHNLDLNPFAQLIADAELGRKVREAGLNLK